MYLDFYQLREYPFTLASDPRFLYFSEAHKEAAAGLLYALRERKGVALLVGEPGTGKTTLLRAVLEMLPGGVRSQTLDSPLHATPEALLGAVLAGFGLAPAEGLSARLQQLTAWLAARHAAGECVVLLIDEAQDLNPVALEQVRLLTNLESGGHKLLQIVLSGQPELGEHLRTSAGRALEQRIAIRCRLRALAAAEVEAYVQARLACAGSRVAGGAGVAPAPLFEPAAIARLARLSGGVPRVINVLADHALLAGFAARAARIGPAEVERAARQIGALPAPAATPANPAAAAEPAAVAPPAARRIAPAAEDEPRPAPAPPAAPPGRPAVLERFVRGWARWTGLARPNQASGE